MPGGALDERSGCGVKGEEREKMGEPGLCCESEGGGRVTKAAVRGADVFNMSMRGGTHGEGGHGRKGCVAI